MNIELHIERMILDGLDLPPYQRPALQAAVETELTRLIVEQRGVNEAPTSHAPLSFATPLNPAQAGKQIARQVYESLKREIPWSTLAVEHQATTGALPEQMSEALNSPGQLLDTKTRAEMEEYLGQDLSRVRVHTDQTAARVVSNFRARAVTIGREVLFGEDQFNLGTATGRGLLAHELTHVVQQNFGRVVAGPMEMSEIGSVYEREAQTIGREVRSGGVNQRAAITRTATWQLAADKNPPGWDEIHNYKHPGNVTVGITVFKTTGMSKDFTQRYIDKAKAMLKDHGLGLDVYTHPTALAWKEPLQTIDQVLELRMLAHKAYQDTRPRLPLIFAPMHQSTHATGQTYPNTDWLPFAVLNSEEESQDGVTLLHEMGHAAKVPGRVDAPVGKDDVVHNFMEYGENRNDMHKQQVIAIANSYFAK